MINGIGNNSFYQTERPNQKMDPDAYAQQYATQNGMSVDDAKNTLKSQFGEPQAKDSGSIFTQQGIGSEYSSQASSAAQPQEEEQNSGDSSITEILKMLMSLLGGQNQGQSQSAAQ